MKYYAVKWGVVPGIYNSWTEAEKMVKGFSGAVYKSFADHKEAEELMKSSSEISAVEKLERSTEKTIIIYTDGSSKDYQGGIGVCICHPNGTETQFCERVVGHCTNNKAELLAIFCAIQYILEIDVTYQITLYTDSNYCVSIFNDYIHTWLNNNWITSKGTPVENQTIIYTIYNSHYNDLVDRLAEEGRSKPEVETQN